MPLTGSRTFVGFGFGPIQSGLFLYEAFRSGRFRRLVAAEVLTDVVEVIRRAQGWYAVNVAHSDRVEVAPVGPMEIENPAVEPDRRRLVAAVAEAAEIATAVPSVDFYVSSRPGSIHRLLSEGLRKKVAEHGARAVVYAAENHNHAAEILEARVFDEIPPNEHNAVRARVRFLNTVIGKMSGVVSDPSEVQARALARFTPEDQRAFLVEVFNRILISKISFEEAPGELGFRRGIAVFEEKDDLLPFEEAKLYGHNATHALAAYVGALRGLQRMADLRQHPDIFRFLRAAFMQESGEALIRKHGGKDRLFSPEGYREYADDLLERMTNPYLGDSVERVGRDPQRKLGWDDRLVGTLRVAVQQGLVPRRLALGVAAALAVLDQSFLSGDAPAAGLLEPLWGKISAEREEKLRILDLVEDGRHRLRRWCESGFQDLENFFPCDHCR
jgi:mannitol-1-phosphate 5-dehydrogenase